MSQINVNAPPPRTEVVEDVSGDRSAAAGINLITVLIVLAVLAVVAWFLFTGPLRSMGSASTDSGTNVTVNTPPQQPGTTINVEKPQVNVNPPAQAPAKAP